MTTSTKILGIDPGYGRLGYGVIASEKGALVCLTFGCIETSPNDSLPERLLEIAKQLRVTIQEYQPAVVIIETLRFAKNQTTAIAVAEARGVVLLIAAEAGIPVMEMTPLEVKQSLTNSGQADKKQVQAMVARVLQLKDIPKPDDAADALAVAIAGEPRWRLARAAENSK